MSVACTSSRVAAAGSAAAGRGHSPSAWVRGVGDCVVEDSFKEGRAAAVDRVVGMLARLMFFASGKCARTAPEPLRTAAAHRLGLAAWRAEMRSHAHPGGIGRRAVGLQVPEVAQGYQDRRAGPGASPASAAHTQCHRERMPSGWQSVKLGNWRGAWDFPSLPGAGDGHSLGVHLCAPCRKEPAGRVRQGPKPRNAPELNPPGGGSGGGPYR
jgi:hypothetical protein